MPKRDHGPLAESWWSAVPTTGPVGTAATWIGISFDVTVPGRLAGFRAFIDATENGNSVARLWYPDGQENLVACIFHKRATTGNQWHQTWFRPWIRLTPGQECRFAVMFPHGRFYRNTSGLPAPVTHNHLTFNNGFQTTSLVPDIAALTLTTNANAIDLLFYPD